MKIINYLDQKLYPHFDNNWDDKIFRSVIESKINENMIILDIGAGAGIVKEMNFKNYSKKICGIDLDERVLTNKMLDEAKVANASNIPYPDETFDIIFADNVMEHLEQPLEVFIEINRVLKNGGTLLFKTPNRNHYMPIIARLTPLKFHQFINKLRGRNVVDTFPTHYKANSFNQIEHIAGIANYEQVKVKFYEGRPEYLRINAIFYVFGFLYERLVNFSTLFEKARIVIIAELRKR